MKKFFIPLLALTVIACNNAGKDSVEKADSANEANLDTALNRNTTTIDETSSAFLVRVANNGMAEVDIATHAQEKGSYADVKKFASMLYHDHSGVNQAVKEMAASKNVTLPTVVTPEKQADIDKMKKLSGKELDKEFVKAMVKGHESSIESFEKALLDVKDPDVRSFADKTLPALRAHLDSARALDKKYWK